MSIKTEIHQHIVNVLADGEWHTRSEIATQLCARAPEILDEYRSTTSKSRLGYAENIVDWAGGSWSLSFDGLEYRVRNGTREYRIKPDPIRALIARELGGSVDLVNAADITINIGATRYRLVPA